MKNETGAYTARVIDFGYSTVYTGRGRIEIPRTEGWEAPEWAQRGGFSFSEARKVDVFSFGLVCLWLLLYDYSNPLNICKLRREARNMAAFACDRVRLQSALDDLKKQKLMMLFMSTLTSDPEERSSDFDPILQYLTARRYDLKQRSKHDTVANHERRSDALNLSVRDLTYNTTSLPTFSVRDVPYHCGYLSNPDFETDWTLSKAIL